MCRPRGVRRGRAVKPGVWGRKGGTRSRTEVGVKKPGQTEGRAGGGGDPREQPVSEVVVKVGWMRFGRHGWQDLLPDAPCERKSGE